MFCLSSVGCRRTIRQADRLICWIRVEKRPDHHLFVETPKGSGVSGLHRCAHGLSPFEITHPSLLLSCLGANLRLFFACIEGLHDLNQFPPVRLGFVKFVALCCF